MTPVHYEPPHRSNLIEKVLDGLPLTPLEKMRWNRWIGSNRRLRRLRDIRQLTRKDF